MVTTGYGGNPDDPIAWGANSYEKLYNWIWFYNGYHPGHHSRPKVHWTRIQAFRDQIAAQPRAARVRVIKPPHALGFSRSRSPDFDEEKLTRPAIAIAAGLLSLGR